MLGLISSVDGLYEIVYSNTCHSKCSSSLEQLLLIIKYLLAQSIMLFGTRYCSM